MSAMLESKMKREWQDTGYVLGYFGKKQTEARKKYESFVKDGIIQGRRKELTGGGLIRNKNTPPKSQRQTLPPIH